MPRTHARIAVTIWQDEDFLAQPVTAQWAYMLILSQPDLSAAGVLWYRPARWASRAANVTAEHVERAVTFLESARFVVVDRATEELLVRTFIKNDQIWKTPNVFLSALRTVPGTLSRTLRATLREELQRLPLDQLTGPKGGVVRAEVAELVKQLPAPQPPTPPGTKNQQVNGHATAPTEPAIGTVREGFGERFGEGMPEPAGVRGMVTEVGNRIPLTPNSELLPPSAADEQSSHGDPGKQLVLVASNGSPTAAVANPLAVIEPPDTSPRGINLRAQALARRYAEHEPMCNFPQIMRAAKKAINSGKYPADDDIGEALVRLAKDGRPVTTDSLRIELEGLPAARKAARQQETDDLFARAEMRIAAREAAGQ